MVELRNSSFEGDYIAYQGIGELRVAPDWIPWYADGLKSVPGLDGGGFESIPTKRPEYNKADVSLDAYRVHSGSGAQHWFCFSGTGYAGVYQKVEVEPGSMYQASLWSHAWCGIKDSDPHSCKRDIAYISVGIDPDGGDWYGSRSILWTQWSMLDNVYRKFDSVVVTANKSMITLYVSVVFKWAVMHNDVYVDDAQMVKVECGTEPEPPEPPEPPTYEVDYARIKADMLDALAEWDRR